MIGALTSRADVLNLRTSSRPLASLLSEYFFRHSPFHVTLDEIHIQEFEKMVKNSNAHPVQHLKMASRRLRRATTPSAATRRPVSMRSTKTRGATMKTGLSATTETAKSV
jgi:hypothetical protein